MTGPYLQLWSNVTLTIEEIELFKAVDLWATKECERQDLAADEEAKRRLLGEEIIKGIRFLIMDEKDFASVVLDSEILTKEEIVSVLKLRNLVPSPSKEFSTTKRSGSESNIQRCCRFNSFLNRRLQYNQLRDDDFIVFSVDKDIKLLGVCLFGSENKSCSVELKVGMWGSGAVFIHKTGRFSSELLLGEKFTYFGFNVLFDNVVLHRNTGYYLKAKITRPDWTYGDNGDSIVPCSGVTFTFRTSSWLRSNTTVQQGQFPELLFSVL